MALQTHQFGPNKRITAHLLTQVGQVAVGHNITAAQTAQANAVAKIYADFTSRATFSLHVAIYDFRLTSQAAETMVGALNERAKAGVDVRIAYNHARKERTPEVFAALGDDPAPLGNETFMKTFEPAVLRKGVQDTAELVPPVQDEPIDPGSHLMHSKYIVRDGTLPSAAVLMGSTNFTNDAWSLQDNNIVIFEQAPELARFYTNDFGEMWDSGKIANSGRDDIGTVMVDGIPVTVAFSPGQGRQIDTDIAAAIGTAEDRLLVASMVISSGAVLGAMVDRAHRVAEFGGVFDGPQMAGVMKDWARVSQPSEPLGKRARAAIGQARAAASSGKAQLFAAIAPLLHAKQSEPYGANTPHNFMHDKLAVCDDTVVTGSFNFSTNATRNAENVVMIKSQAVADAYAAYVQELEKRYPQMGLGGTP